MCISPNNYIKLRLKCRQIAIYLPSLHYFNQVFTVFWWENMHD